MTNHDRFPLPPSDEVQAYSDRADKMEKLETQKKLFENTRASHVHDMVASGLLGRVRHVCEEQGMVLDLDDEGVESVLSPDNFGVSTRVDKDDADKQYLLVNHKDGSQVTVGIRSVGDDDRPRVESNIVEGFTEADADSVLFMVQELEGLREAGHLPNLSRDLTAIVENPAKTILTVPSTG